MAPGLGAECEAALVGDGVGGRVRYGAGSGAAVLAGRAAADRGADPPEFGGLGVNGLDPVEPGADGGDIGAE